MSFQSYDRFTLPQMHPWTLFTFLWARFFEPARGTEGFSSNSAMVAHCNHLNFWNSDQKTLSTSSWFFSLLPRPEVSKSASPLLRCIWIMVFLQGWSWTQSWRQCEWWQGAIEVSAAMAYLLTHHQEEYVVLSPRFQQQAPAFPWISSPFMSPKSQMRWLHGPDPSHALYVWHSCPSQGGSLGGSGRTFHLCCTHSNVYGFNTVILA